ncbi:MAG: 30S ribosomal protein S6 [Dehalococcoidales bacterium]
MASKNNNKEELKTEDKQLRDYELIFIISPEVEEETLEATVGSVTQFITGKDGIISDEERWGKRKLAYPLKRFREGNYVLTRFKMRPVWSKELEASLQISEEILRHLLIKIK